MDSLFKCSTFSIFVTELFAALQPEILIKISTPLICLNRGQFVQMFDVSIFVTELFAALQLEILIKIRPVIFRAFSSMFLAVFSMF